MCDLMREDRGLRVHRFESMVNAIMTAALHMLWRSTYADTAEFMDRWGRFRVLGDGGPFAGSGLRVFVVQMPAGLYHPSHRHPAEEMYLVIAGRANFIANGRPSVLRHTGQTVFHSTNEVHAIETTDSPMLALVAWRTHLNVAPVLVPEADPQRQVRCAPGHNEGRSKIMV